MSTGLKANLDGSAAIQVGGSDAIQLTTGLAATFVNNVSVTGNLSVSGSGVITGAIKSGTVVATTSGTSAEFTGIPSGVKRITLMLNGVSTNGTGAIQIQIGSSSYSISGYIAGSQVSAQTSITTGFNLVNSGSVSASNTLIGAYTLTLFNSNTWIGNGVMYVNGSNNSFNSGISPALGGALDRIRIIGSATGNPADTFDAGSINILYE